MPTTVLKISVLSVLFHAMLLAQSVNNPAAARVPPVESVRIPLQGSMQVPLPQPLEVDGIAPVSSSVWFLGLDRSQTPPVHVIYGWSQSGLRQIPIEGASASIQISALATDPQERAWVVTDQGLFRSSDDTFRHQTAFDTLHPGMIAGNRDLWVVSATNELYYVFAWQPENAAPRKLPVAGTITRIALAPDGGLWIVVHTDQGDHLLEADGASDSVRELAAPAGAAFPVIAAVFADSSGALWLSAQNGDLLRYVYGAWSRFGAELGLPAVPLTAMAQDPSGDLILVYPPLPGQQANYLSVSAASRLSTLPEFRNIVITGLPGELTAAGFDLDGGAWLGSRQGALRLQGVANLKWKNSAPADTTSSTSGSASSNSTAVSNPDTRRGNPLLRGVRIQSLPIRAPNLTTAKFSSLFSTRGLPGDQVSSTVADNQGRLYFTTGYAHLVNDNAAGGGIGRWNHLSVQTFTTANGLASNTVQASLYDSSTNLIWFGTTNGISRFNPANDTFASVLLSGSEVHALRKDGNGNIWVATFGGGIYVLNPVTGATIQQFTFANTSHGLVNDNIAGLTITADSVWVATDRGGPVSGTELVGGLSRYQFAGGTWTAFDLNVLPAPFSFDSNRVTAIESDAAGNVWFSLFNPSGAGGVFRWKAADGSFARFSTDSTPPLGVNTTNAIYAIYRDLAGNLWFSFGAYGSVTTPRVAATFLPADQVNSSAPPFQNFNDSNGFPSNLIVSFFQEDASTMWFGFMGGGVGRLGGPGDQPGWPQTTSGLIYTSSPVLADLNGDGNLEVIIGDQAGHVYAYQPNGVLLWNFDAHTAFPAAQFPSLGDITIQSSPSVGDVDGDGNPEVVVGVGGFLASNIGPTGGAIGNGQGAVLVISNTGTLKHAYFPYDITTLGVPLSKEDGYREGVFSTPALANTDDDPELEIHVSALDNFFYAFNADGSPIYSVDNDGDGRFDEDFFVDWTPFTPLNSANFAPGWFDVAALNLGLSIYDDDEDGLADEDWPEFPFWNNDTSTSSAAIADLDGSGSLKIVYGQDYTGGPLPLGPTFARGGILRVLDTKGQQPAGWPQGNIEQTVKSSPTLADLDGDGKLEIIHGTGFDLSGIGSDPSQLLIGQSIYAWKSDGSSFLSTGVAGKLASTQGVTDSSVAVGDLYNDGNLEMVTVTSRLADANGNPVDASGNPTTAANTVGQQVYAFRKDGSVLPGFPIRPFPFIPNIFVLGTPAIADVNGDGFPEIIIPAGFGLIVIDHLGHVLPGMGNFENLQDPNSQVIVQSAPAVADIDRDGILEVVWALGLSSDGGHTVTSGVIRVAKLGPVNAAGYAWPMFRRTAERTGVYDVSVSQPTARVSGASLIVSALVLKGRNPITSVLVDLSPLGGGVQPMNDTGANGDQVANDAYYSVSFPATGINPGRYYLKITATDSLGRTSQGTVTYVQHGTGKRLITNLSAIDFGSVGVGLNGDRHLNLINVGDTAVTITSAQFSNSQFFVDNAISAFSGRSQASPAIFVSPKSFPQTIAPGSTLNLLLRVHPALNATGAQTATLTLNSDDPSQPTRTLGLTASALKLNGSISVTADNGSALTTLEWPPTKVGSTNDNSIKVSSTGSDPLIIQSVHFDNPAYSVWLPTSPSAPRTFVPGTLTVFHIRFAPTVTGQQNANMTLTTNDPLHPTVVVPLVATGLSGTAAQTISFGALSNIPVNTPPFGLTATASSALPVTYVSNTLAVCTVSGSTVTVATSGGCSITASQAGNGSFTPAAPVTQRFTVLFADITTNDTAATAADLLAQYGITAGCGSNDYCPDANVTRAQMAIFMVRAIEGGDNFTFSPTPWFTDVQSTDFGFKWIQKMKELGITAGCGVNVYCPNDNVTRAQMAIFIIRARLGLNLAGSPPAFTYSNTSLFTDVAPGDLGYAWIQRMKRDGITAGCTATTYCPNDPVTRGQMAIFVMRAAYNLLLPVNTPVLTQINPSILLAGTSRSYTITGTNTHFVQGTTTLSPLPGVTIGAITVNSPTSLTVQLTAAPTATAQPYSILAITGAEEDVLPNGLTIQ